MKMNQGDLAASIENLKVHFPVRGGFLHFGEQPTLKAVDGVSLQLAKGEILGLVGESGCGKSSLGRAVMRLIRVTDGKIDINGVDFLSLSGRELRRARTNIQMIFQDPYASLDPRMTVFDIVAEPVRAHLSLNSKELNDRVKNYLELVGLRFKSAKKYPHEFSGGQRQRIAIARALILEPKVVIADEPVSSLDVSVQAQILNLLKDIQRRLGLSMIFISHNLAVVKYISDRIAVMYLGKIVEIADREDLYKTPLHPYTRGLISAVPIPDPKLERSRVHIQVKGELPSPINPPKGCAFHTRCPLAFDRCRAEQPSFKQPPGYQKHWVSCFAVDENPPKT
jgi:oligopeptide transport system ATP-binding protein